jgi:hypothetical protein
MGRRIAAGLALLLATLGAFAAGYAVADRKREDPATKFHDMRVLHPEALTSLVDGDDPTVREYASYFATYRAAYEFVRDRIAFEPSRPADAPATTIREGAGSCLGKAALLASFYRAMGLGHEEVRVVTGQVHYGEQLLDHAWVELEHEGVCLQQDPTPLLGTFGHDRFTGTRYTERFVYRELFCFNDRGLAVVSQLNRFRGTGVGGIAPP